MFVSTIVGLLYAETEVDIYLLREGRTYRFDSDDLPDEISFCCVHSIDDPSKADGARPLCINIDDEEQLDDVQEFVEMFSDYEQ